MQRTRQLLLVGIVSAATIGGALPAEPAKELTNSVGMKFVLIPAGEFLMGSPELPEEQAKTLPRWTIEGLKCEQPQHTVRITKPFYLSVTEVTQEQYTTVLGARHWRLLSGMMPGADEIRGELWEKHDYPAFDIGWDEAVEFCRKLSAKEGRTYRLPTEAEWEYACRATTTTKWCCGDEKASLGHYAWYYRGAIARFPVPVCFRMRPSRMKSMCPWTMKPIRTPDHTRSRRRNLIAGGCTTCTATSRNGAMIGLGKTISRACP